MTLQPIPTYLPLISAESAPLFDELAQESGLYLAEDEALEISDAEFSRFTDEAVALTKPEPEPERLVMSGWDKFWCAVWISLYVGIILGCFAAWMLR